MGGGGFCGVGSRQSVVLLGFVVGKREEKNGELGSLEFSGYLVIVSSILKRYRCVKEG